MTGAPSKQYGYASTAFGTLPQPDRVRLELNGLYYSLYCFYLVHGEPEKAKDAIAELLKVAYPGAFAYTKAVPIARKLGLLPE